MILNNKFFTILKWILATAIAPLIILINGIGEIFDYDVTLIVKVITLISTFLGALLGVSNYNYKKENK